MLSKLAYRWMMYVPRNYAHSSVHSSTSTPKRESQTNLNCAPLLCICVSECPRVYTQFSNAQTKWTIRYDSFFKPCARHENKFQSVFFTIPHILILTATAFQSRALIMKGKVLKPYHFFPRSSSHDSSFSHSRTKKNRFILRH